MRHIISDIDDAVETGLGLFTENKTVLFLSVLNIYLSLSPWKQLHLYYTFPVSFSIPVMRYF